MTTFVDTGRPLAFPSGLRGRWLELFSCCVMCPGGQSVGAVSADSRSGSGDNAGAGEKERETSLLCAGDTPLLLPPLFSVLCVCVYLCVGV
jgi:hypothetical protein